MNENVDYYRQLAAEFYRSTVAVDMTRFGSGSWRTSWLSAVERSEVWMLRDQRADRDETWTNALVFMGHVGAWRLVTGGRVHSLPDLSAAMAKPTDVNVAVAFVKTTGLRLLLPDLRVTLFGRRRTPRPRADQRLSGHSRSGALRLFLMEEEAVRAATKKIEAANPKSTR